jgi:hypothetical protein
MTDESDDPDDRSERGETPSQPDSEEFRADDDGTDPANDTGSAEAVEGTATDPSDDSGGSDGEAEAQDDATDAADTGEAPTDPDEGDTPTPEGSPAPSNEPPETDPDPPGDGPADDGDPERTWLGVGTAVVVPVVGVLGAVVLFAIDFDPLDALLVGFAYLSLVTVGTGLYVFTNESERRGRLLRATGGFAAALLGVSVVVVLTADTDLIEVAPVVSQPVPLFVYVYAVAGALGYVFTVVGEQRLNSSGGSGSEDTTDASATEESGSEPGSRTNDSEEGDATGDPPDPDVPAEPIEASKIYDWSIRVLAAIPLAAAVFLLASLLLPQSQFGDPEVVVRTADGVVTVNETGVSGRLNETSSVQDVDVERRQRSDRLLAGLALLTGLFVNTAYTRLHDLAVRLLNPSRRGGNGGSE